jgi:cytochrome d ubiquinol oxidase subunit I
VLTNNTALSAYAHTLTASFAVAGAFLLGIAWYQLWRRRHDGIDTIGDSGRVIAGGAPEIPGRDRADHRVWLWSLRVGAIVAIVGFGAVAITGDAQGKLLFQQQPLKMAAAEAACENGSSFSVLTIGDVGARNCDQVKTLIAIPGLLSFLAKGDFNTTVEGVDSLVPQYQAKYGTTLPDNKIYGSRAGESIQYVPLMAVTYWGFRLMIGFGVMGAFAAAVALWLTRKGTVPGSAWLMRLALLGIMAPFAASSAGWIFTEMGRQPFVVAPNPTGVDGVFMFTAAALSPGVTAGELLFSTITLTSVYLVLAVLEVSVLVRFVRGGIASAMPELAEAAPSGSDDEAGPPGSAAQPDDVLSFAY